MKTFEQPTNTLHNASVAELQRRSVGAIVVNRKFNGIPITALSPTTAKY